VETLATVKEAAMFRTAEPLPLRLVVSAGDRPLRGSAAVPRTFPPLDELDARRPPPAGPLDRAQRTDHADLPPVA
jgi:hypothetical protein